jgi:RNA polymerase sigma-54 factor
MAMSQRLELRQGQSLVMTPQLQQAIKLLQMSNFELQAYVEEELERNPLLERDEGARSETAPSDSVERAAASHETTMHDLSSALTDDGPAAEKLESMGTDLSNVYADEAQADKDNRLPGATMDSGWSSLRSTSAASHASDRPGFDFEATLKDEPTLADHLTEQLNLTISDPGKRLIGQFLLGSLNEAGYLAGNVAQISEQLGASIAEVEDVLATLQKFDPPGILARDLKECLAIQLVEKDRYDPAMQTLVENLELLAKRDFAKLQKLCGVDLEDITAMVDEIRELNPKPGNAIGDVVVQPVIPDVNVRQAPDGNWLVELNSETLPRVLVNNQYFATVSSGAKSQDDKVYLDNCLSDATWLAKSLDQRARTILAVSREIVRQQDGFLVHGITALKPLNLKTVADAIDMHESTVSRVTSNKYMSTPRGVFELKYFFTTAIASTDGSEAHSAEAVRHMIKSMIDSETPENVLSDDAIVSALHEHGIELARRTVAKYRESMRISSSVQRRREKKLRV